MQVQISAVIITFNEEKNIERCILSVKKVADEILVVDSFSTDKTKEICEKHGVSFYQHEWEGYAVQKNLANGKASFDYVISLDADEALSSELEESILNEKRLGLRGVYKFNRLTNYCGSWIRHTSWYPDSKIRLFDRKACYWKGNIHEKLVFNEEEVVHLNGDLLHYSFYTRQQHLLQIEKFSSLAARELYEKGKKMGVVQLYLKVGARFFKNYISKLGFLDGKAGFDVSRYSAFATYLRYSKLRALNKQSTR